MILPIPLPRGISGFEYEGPVREWNDIKKEILGAFHAQNLKVGEIKPCDNEVARNYHLVFFSEGAILIHQLFPYIAFAAVQSPPYLRIPFADNASLVHAVSKWLPDWKYLPSRELLQNPTSEALVQLGKEEHKQLQYFKPRTIGDLIFNNWD